MSFRLTIALNYQGVNPQQIVAFTSKIGKKNDLRNVSHDFLVPGAGIEPARIAARDFESRASTNSATRAFGIIHYCIIAITLL